MLPENRPHLNKPRVPVIQVQAETPVEFLICALPQADLPEATRGESGPHRKSNRHGSSAESVDGSLVSSLIPVGS